MKKTQAEAAAFFQADKGFKRLMSGFIKNYRRLGRIGGTVKLAKPTLEEKEALSGVMGRDYSQQNSIAISVADFQRALDRTKFAGLDLKDLLHAYAGGKLLTRSQEDKMYQQEKEAYFSALSQENQGENAQVILQYITSKALGTRGIHQAYDSDSSLLKERLNHALRAVESLPKTFERLPVFAYRISKDPHNFDLNTENGRLLIIALQIIRAHKDTSCQIISSPTAEEITDILADFKIVRDDLLNFVTCTGLLGLKKDGQIITMWQEAFQEGVVINLPLRELARIESFAPVEKHACTGKTVYIVENSSVFSEILDSITNKKTPPLICTHGQFKLAALLLMDKLAQSGTDLYYSGDFDPEGLQMAQRLLERYPQSLKLWRYTVKDYESCISQVSLSQTRLNKMENIKDPSLIAIKNKMVSSCKAGYQEQLVPLLAKDIMDCINN